MDVKDASCLITRPAARRILGVGESALDALISEGRLTVRRVPGSIAKLVRAEVIELAEASTTVRASA